MQGKNLQGRITRLQELIMRLSQEDLSWKDDVYPLHYIERNAYLSAIHKAIGALSEARIVLSQATPRLVIRNRSTPAMPTSESRSDATDQRQRCSWVAQKS
jgi:hypothetical protein